MKIMKITTFTIFSITLLTSIVSSQDLCNGYSELCDRKFSDVAYATTHNAYSVDKPNVKNQNFGIDTQLKDGIRGLMLDAWYSDSGKEVHLCHGGCNILDAGKAVDTLSLIATWLNDNPNEVITILWENAAKVPAATFNDLYTQSGLAKFAYFQEVGKDWPTLSNMIQSGKRAVNFVDNGADPSVQWLMEEYDYVFETPFQNTDINGFQCTIDRPKNQERPMYVLNHFLYRSLGPPFSSGGDQIDIPQPDQAPITNSANLAGHAQQCQQTFSKISKIPNFIAVDFYDQGSDGQNVFSTVANLNGVKYIAKPLGNGTDVSSNPGKTKKSTDSSAQLNTELRSVNIIAGLAGVGALAMFVL